MQDYKDRIMAEAEQVAQERFDLDFYDLATRDRDDVWREAEERAASFYDGLADERLDAARGK